MWNNLLLGSIVAACCIIVFQWVQIDNLEDDNQDLQAQINSLEVDSRILTDRYDDAKNDAAIDMQRSQEEGDLIMMVNLPKSCDAAISWGIEQAKSFKA